MPKIRKPIPFDFVLEALAPANPYTKPMFGCTSVYVDEKIVLILRDKPEPAADRGIWVATTGEHHESLREDFPSLRSIELFGPGPTGWQVLPESEMDFEESALKACRFILSRDPRIGKVPKSKKAKTPKTRRLKKGKSARSSTRRPKRS